MILLELTEKEAEVLRKLTEMERDVAGFNYTNNKFEENLRDLEMCDSLLKKFDLASEPQKEILITVKDLFLIISSAKTEYRNVPLDAHISHKKVDECDFKHISFANAVILWLNGNRLLKKLVKFDYTDKSNEYETTEE